MLNREEIRKMFQLTDIRKTVVWQEARDEGLVEGIKGLLGVVATQVDRADAAVGGREPRTAVDRAAGAD